MEIISNTVQTIVYYEPLDVARRLGELGIPGDIIREAVKMGQAARNDCTDNDPFWFPGSAANAKTTRGARELLKPHGFRRKIDRGLELVQNATDTFRFAIASGDAATGNPNATPSTRYPRGNATAAVLDENTAQLPLPINLTPNVVPLRSKLKPAQQGTWWLLFCAFKDEVRCELSLPLFMDDDNKISTWRERIILERVVMGPAPKKEIERFDEAGPEHEVNVSKRPA